MLTEKNFIEVIKKIKKQEEIDDEISKALDPVCEGNGFFYCGGQLYLSALLDVLNESMEVIDKDIIEWWLYEDVDKIIYIDNKKIDVSDSKDFYRYLVNNRKENKKMLKVEKNLSRYLVFIKSEYVRDAQAYIEGKIQDVEDEGLYTDEKECNWWDVEGDILVMDIQEENMEAVMNRIKVVYPTADEKIFNVIVLKQPLYCN